MSSAKRRRSELFDDGEQDEDLPQAKRFRGPDSHHLRKLMRPEETVEERAKEETDKMQKIRASMTRRRAPGRVALRMPMHRWIAVWGAGLTHDSVRDHAAAIGEPLSGLSEEHQRALRAETIFRATQTLMRPLVRRQAQLGEAVLAKLHSIGWEKAECPPIDGRLHLFLDKTQASPWVLYVNADARNSAIISYSYHLLRALDEALDHPHE